MTVQEQTPYIEYTANGVATGFALDFDCESKDHLIVTLDGVEPPVGSWSLIGGAVVFTTAPANGVLVVVHRNTPFSRTTDYQSYNNSFRPPVINKDFDWIWLKLQELGVADWILGNRISALKNYVDRKDDELKAYLMEEIRKQGVALDQLDEYYNYLMERLAQIAVDKGWDASFVVDGPLNQHQINTGLNSVNDLLKIENPAFGMRVYVKNSGMYVYEASNEWVIQDEYTYSRLGNFEVGILLKSEKDILKHNGMYYFYKGDFPHVCDVLSPNSDYQCIGLQNGHAVNHTRNWGIKADGSNETSKVLFMLLNCGEENIISDKRPIHIKNLEITTDKAIKCLTYSKLNFAPYFSAPEISIDYMIKLNYSETSWDDIKITNPPDGKFVESIFVGRESIRHLFNRIQLSCQSFKFGTVFDLGLVKESGFTNLRIDLDTSTKQGVVFKSTSCVNNWITGGMYGYGQYFLHCVPEPYAGVQYKSEGWMLDGGLIAVYFRNPLNIQSGTALHAESCIFDFCIEKMFEFTNGSFSKLIDCWFANDETSSVTVPCAVVAAGQYKAISIVGNTFINNNGDNNTPLFSVNPLDAGGNIVANNACEKFTKGILLNCTTHGNEFLFAGNAESYSTCAFKIDGISTIMTNDNTLGPNTQIHGIEAKSKLTSAIIVAETSNYADISRWRFLTKTGDGFVEQMIMGNGRTILPTLPQDTNGAGVNGLYAGADGVVKINR